MSETCPVKAGERAHVTIEAETYDIAGGRIGFRVHAAAGTANDTWWPLWEDSANVVRIERAPVVLPTGFGARIRATVTHPDRPISVPDVLLVHAPTRRGDHFRWLSASRPHGLTCWWADEQLSDVVVLDAGEPS